MIEIKAPNEVPLSKQEGLAIFLAGSIEMGKAVDWQKQVKETLKDRKVTILNPRRDDWDNSWTQSIDNPQFNEQVNWELNNIIRADVVFFYLAPGTYSPISMMELGYVAGHPYMNVIVVCPHNFWRKGNVDILCKREYIPVFETLEDGIQALLGIISEV